MSVLKSMPQVVNEVRQRFALRRDPIAYFREKGLSIGRDCSILGPNNGTFGSEPYLVSLGNHVRITSGVRFVTHDGGVWTLRQEHPEVDVFGRITVGDNVFIGINSVVMPGVTIGDNVVIGAHSIVTRDIPDNSVAAGNPARVLSSRESYAERSLEKAVNTKALNPAEKRRYLTENADSIFRQTPRG